MEPPAPLSDLEKYFGNIVAVFLELAGVALFFMIIIGGFNYLTSEGNPQKAEAAKKIITSAIFGFILLSLSFLILKLIYQFTGVDITQFTIKVK